MSYTKDLVIKKLNDEKEILEDFDKKFGEFLINISIDYDNIDQLEGLDDELRKFTTVIRTTINQLESI